MEKQPLFHVVLHGRKVGPYDRRTIVGMRIKGTLDSDHVLIDTDGNQLSVADLIGTRPRANDFQPNRTSGYSIVQATYPASLRSVTGKGHAIPAFQGEVEARVQNDVVRIAGRFRKGIGWKEDRVKLPLKDIAHARVRGTEVELGVRVGEGRPLQVVRLELFSTDAAGDMLGWLPDVAPWPAGLASVGPAVLPGKQVLWLSVASASSLIVVVLVVLLSRRIY
jgi:hypothetical protein